MNRLTMSLAFWEGIGAGAGVGSGDDDGESVAIWALTNSTCSGRAVFDDGPSCPYGSNVDCVIKLVNIARAASGLC